MRVKRIRKLLNNKWLYIILGLSLFLYVIVRLNIKENSRLNPDDDTFIGIVERVNKSENKVSYTIRLDGEKLICNKYLNGEEEVEYFSLGSVIKVKGTLKDPTNNTVPNTFNYKRYLYYHDIFYICNVDSIETVKENKNIFYVFKNAFIERIMIYDIKDYLYTMIIGDKSFMDSEKYEKYRLNGVTHLFAISGMHIGLFSGVIVGILRRFKLRDSFCLVIATLFMFLYAFLTGFSSSVLRACIMFFVLSINKIFKLEISSLKALFITGTIQVVLNYKVIMDIGFIYSFVITFGLMYYGNFLKKHKIIGTSLVATLFSIPITVYNFYKLNLFSLVNNLIFVPYVTTIVYPLCLLTFVFRFLEPITKFFIEILELLNSLLANVTIFNVVIPKLDIVFIVGYYLILLFKFDKKPYKITFILVAMIIFYKLKPYLDFNYNIMVVDVGQGDSIILRSPNSREVILVDTGGIVNSNYHPSSNIVTYLNSLGIGRISTIVLTHGDYDHMGESIYLMDNLKIDRIVFNNDSYNELETELIKVLENKNIKYYNGLKELNIGNDKLDFLNTKEYDNENDNSNVIYFKLNNYKFLFMGDAGVNREKDILDKYNLNDIDFIKIGHHGSDTSSSEYFISSIKPKNCLISVGKNNRYGHPKDSVINILDDYCNIYRTDINGSVEIRLNKNNYKIKTYSP